ncbi:tRNA (guanosine(46)-N7)-methyltransferase TrmB [Pantoea sp. Aalb]|uniref:tRNA (guanosine(46)-N7)-methyltransferase TrmB n=1 Tax=Pantoea sp. Aalb TaxID=2576762 RepID=UPI0013224375|nr:tRNA (guanosine(46)-N7)-methyltransferase TrmB [Pantoea sp. Aalb]MXP67716.1 tRNA (guanosine(46)-N7)-methyltransferase TrmB [Pantoea sp. Aalb]
MNNLITLKLNKNNQKLHHIRSFMCRQGRLTKKQQFAIYYHWPEIGIGFKKELINLVTLFKYDAPLIMEIGFGMGNSLVAMAKNNPHINFLGIEVYIPGIGACLASAKEAGVKNLRMICYDAIEVLQEMIPDNTLFIVQLFFPDPWHKIRHNKRRILQLSFAQLVLKKLQIGGVFHIITDSRTYANHILKIINSIDCYINELKIDGPYPLILKTRPLTKFEKRASLLGNNIWELFFTRVT